MSWIDEYTKGLQGQTFQPGEFTFQPSGYAGGRPFYMNPTYSQSPMEAAGLTGLADEFTPANMLAGGGDPTGYTASLTGGSNRNYITNPETGQTGYVQARFGPNGEYIGSEFIPAQSPSGLSDVRTLGPLVVGAATGLGAMAGAGGMPAYADPTMVSGAAPITASQPVAGLGADFAAGGAPITASQPVPGLGSDFARNVGAGAGSMFGSNAMPYLYGANALLGAYGARRAGREQLAGLDQANELAREIYQTNLARQEPFYQAGVDALGRMQRGEFQASPDYGFRLGEGLKQLDRQQSRAGTRLSGRGMKEGQRFASDLASGEFGNWFNRQATLAGFGPAAAGQQQSATSQYGLTSGQNLASQGNVRGSIYGGMTGAAQGGLGGLADYYMINELLGRR